MEEKHCTSFERSGGEKYMNKTGYGNILSFSNGILLQRNRASIHSLECHARRSLDDIRFKTVHDARVTMFGMSSYCNMVVDRLVILRKWRYERIYTALVQVGFCHLKCVLKSCIGQRGL